MAALRGDLIKRLRHVLSRWKLRPAHASLFGSAARGDGHVRSDIDVFIVRPSRVKEGDERWTSQLQSLAVSVARWTGNRMSAAEVSQSQLRRLGVLRPAVAAALESDAVTLCGSEFRALNRGKA